MAKSSTSFSQKHYRKIMTVAVISTIIGLLSTSLSVILLYTTQTEATPENTQIVLDNLSEEDAKSINSQISFSSIKSENSSFYIPALDININYNSILLNVSTNSQGAYLFINNSLNFGDGGDFRKIATSQDIETQMLALLDEGKTEKLKITGTTQKDGITEITGTRVTKSIFTDENKEAYEYFLYKQIDNFVYYIHFTSESNLSDNISNALLEIIKSIDTNTSDLNQTISLSMAKAGLSINFDKKYWTVESNNEFVSAIKALSGKTRIEINVFENYSQKDGITFMTGELENKIDVVSSYVNNFKLTKDKGKEKLNGVDVIVSEYSYDFYDEYYEHSMFGIYNTESKYSILINLTTSPNNEPDGRQAGMEVLNTLTLSKPLAMDVSIGRGNVLGASSMTIDYAAIKARAAIAHIFNRTCVEVKFVADSSLIYSGGKTYNFCSAGTGTGFFVNEGGYLITNSHVAKPNIKDTVFATLNTQNPEAQAMWKDFGFDFMVIALTKDADAISKADDNTLTAMIMYAFNLLVNNGNISLSATYDNYIEGSESFEINMSDLSLLNKDQHLTTEIVDAKEIESSIQIVFDTYDGKKSGISVPDLAILKLTDDKHNFPTLILGDPIHITSGTAIKAIGFPGDADNKMIFSSSAAVIPTVTKGSISAVKPNFNNTFDLIQIDASISHGNSGGPIVNDNAEVLGVATYGMSTNGADFNVGVSVAEVQKMLSSKGISNSLPKVNTHMDDGLKNFTKSYYKYSVRDFESALAESPQLSSLLTPLINSAKSKIDNGEDNSPLFMIGSFEVRIIHIILFAVGVLLLLLGAVVVAIVILKKRSHSKTDTQTPTGGGDAPAPQAQVTNTSIPVYNTTTQTVATGIPVQEAQVNIQPVGPESATAQTPDPIQASSSADQPSQIETTPVSTAFKPAETPVQAVQVPTFEPSPTVSESVSDLTSNPTLATSPLEVPTETVHKATFEPSPVPDLTPDSTIGTNLYSDQEPAMQDSNQTKTEDVVLTNLSSENQVTATQPVQEQVVNEAYEPTQSVPETASPPLAYQDNSNNPNNLQSVQHDFVMDTGSQDMDSTERSQDLNHAQIQAQPSNVDQVENLQRESQTFESDGLTDYQKKKREELAKLLGDNGTRE